MLEIAPARPRRCAPIATFSSTVMSGTSLTCWKVRAMPSFATSCGGALSMLLAEHGDRAAGGGEHAGDQVEGGALAGAVRADQRDDLAGLDVEGDIVDGDHAAELLARIVDLQQHAGSGRHSVARGQGQRCIGPLAVWLERQPRHQPGPDAGRRQLQQDHQQDAEHDGLELALAVKQIRQIALQDFLQDDDDGRAEHAAPDITGAADDRDEEIFDAGLRAERRRVGGALEMRVEPAGEAGQHRGIDEDQKLGARRLHAKRFGGDVSAPQRADGAAGARVQQVHGEQRANQRPRSRSRSRSFRGRSS